MRKVLQAIPLALVVFASGDAYADGIPDGYKSVKLSIRVEADVPAGQTLVLGKTFQGVDMIKPGVKAAVEWHPLGGRLQIRSVPSSAVMPNFEELREKLERKDLHELFKKGKPCHEKFDGFRTVPRSAPADVIQWNYKVTFAGDTCTATLVSMEFFDKAGKSVSGMDIADLPLGVPGVPSNSPRSPPMDMEDAWGMTDTDDPPPPKKGACGCEVGVGAADSEIASLIEKYGPLLSVLMGGLVLGLRRKTGRGEKSAPRNEDDQPSSE
ncbi:MAG TPA: hypothetical protein PKA58_04185 [Polyangium sp.]|nr:hypothetical protein [Polyangium sp.]